MPRLQILHHKSYHPYLEKNKQRVREDEAKAAAEELAREQSRIDAASSSRLDELRRRAGSPSFRPDLSTSEHVDDAGDLPSTSAHRVGEGSGSSLLERHKKEKARLEKREKKARERLDFDFPSESAKREERRRAKKAEGAAAGTWANGRGGAERGDREDMWLDGAGQGEGDFATAWDSGGHINLFADIEKNEQDHPQPSLAEIAKTAKAKESDPFTMYLSRPAKETQPWYADRQLQRYEDRAVGEEAEERRARDKRKDVRSKARHDPLTQIEGLLKGKSSAAPARRRDYTQGQAAALVGDASAARESREKAERQRALDLIAKTKAQAARAAAGNRWDDTPSTMAGGRSWAEDFERQKDRAGMRFFGNEHDRRERVRDWAGDRRTGRSWEV